jgi:tetratricopeptide (TPR) repeat protein
MKTPVSGSAVWIAAFLLLLCTNVSAQSQNQDVANSQLGQKLYLEKKYPEATNTLKKAVKTNPNDGDAWYYLGLSWLKLNDLKNATKAFESAVKVQPNSAHTRSALAYSLLLRNKLKDALKEAERAIALDGNNAEAHFVLGVNYLHLGAREKALNEAEKAIELTQSFAEAYLLKSQSLVQFSIGALVQPAEPPEERANRYQEAAAALETYLRLAPNSPETPMWNEQLASLRFYLTIRDKTSREQNNIYSSRVVTTKARLIEKPEPTYTSTARNNGVHGTVVLRALLASDGMVKNIVVVYGLPDGLTWVSVRAAQKIKFAPATLSGRPVSTMVQLEYNFNLY